MDHVRLEEGSALLLAIADSALCDPVTVMPFNDLHDHSMLVTKVARLVHLLGCQNDFIFFYERRMAARLLRGRFDLVIVSSLFQDFINGAIIESQLIILLFEKL